MERALSSKILPRVNQLDTRASLFEVKARPRSREAEKENVSVPVGRSAETGDAAYDEKVLKPDKICLISFLSAGTGHRPVDSER